MCQILHTHYSLVQHTAGLETFQNASRFQDTFNHFYPNLCLTIYWKSYCFFSPKKYQNNLVSDQNTIILWHTTAKIRFVLQNCHNTSTCTMTSIEEDILESKVLITARFISISKHLFTYLSSTWMRQSVGFSIHTRVPKQKITKISSRDTTTHSTTLFTTELRSLTHETPQDIHVVKWDRVVLRSSLYLTYKELISGTNPPHIELQNFLSWMGSARIIESNSLVNDLYKDVSSLSLWLRTDPLKIHNACQDSEDLLQRIWTYLHLQSKQLNCVHIFRGNEIILFKHILTEALTSKETSYNNGIAGTSTEKEICSSDLKENPQCFSHLKIFCKPIYYTVFSWVHSFS